MDYHFKDHEDFFERVGNQSFKTYSLNGVYYSVSIEELYQVFKERLVNKLLDAGIASVEFEDV